MKWKINSKAIKIPGKISPHREYSVWVENKQYFVAYKPLMGVFFIRETNSILEHPVKVTRSNLNETLSFTEFNAYLELFFNGKDVYLEQRLQIDAPGQSHRMELKKNAPEVCLSPMSGKILEINISEGDTVSKGDCLVIIEAMKMENKVLASKDGTIKKVSIHLNQSVSVNSHLYEIHP